MAPNNILKGKRKATDEAKMPTLFLNQRLMLNRTSLKKFISELIVGLIRICSVTAVNNERPRDLFHAIIFLDPVTTRHLSQFQLIWPHHMSRSPPFWEWWVAFLSYMRQIFDKTRDQMNNWRWDNPSSFGDEVDRSNPQTTNLGNVKRNCECFSLYGSDDLRAKIEPPSCWQRKAGNFLAGGLLNWDEIIEENDNDENCADLRAPSRGRSHHGNGNGNGIGEGEEDTERGENGTRTGKGTMDGKV
jgi:hypothetical protein